MWSKCGLGFEKFEKNKRDLKYDVIYILVIFNEFDSSKLLVFYLNLVVRYMWYEKFNLKLLIVLNFFWIFFSYYLLLYIYVLRWM